MTVIESSPSLRAPPLTTGGLPTIWGLDAIQLHDYYWAARGVQVVRLGERSTVVEGAELFLLTDDQTLLLMRVRPLLDVLSWIAPTVLLVRVHDTCEQRYREYAITGPDGAFRRFDRSYAQQKTIAARVALTTDPDIARAWQAMGDTPWPWRNSPPYPAFAARDRIGFGTPLSAVLAGQPGPVHQGSGTSLAQAISGGHTRTRAIRQTCGPIPSRRYPLPPGLSGLSGSAREDRSARGT